MAQLSRPPHIDFDKLPKLFRDGSFLGMTMTQFLGAFNDNVFKQLVLLLCLDYKTKDFQGYASFLFALPFVLFSGFAGYLSDLTTKKRIIVLSKVAEIAVMLMGLAVFFIAGSDLLQLIYYLMAVLFLMGTQSAFFGPAKYGILPEMLRERDLPQANGIIQMTTFLAIIFGMVIAGYAKEEYRGTLWMVSVICVGIAVVGTLTSLAIRKTPTAHADLRFSMSALAINRETWNLIRHDRLLLGALGVSSVFWFIGGGVLPAVNSFGKDQMKYGDQRTSVLAACMGIGIAVGCALAGAMSKHRLNFRLVTFGAWGITVCLLAMCGLGEVELSSVQIEWLARLTLTLLGVAGGFFAVPIQVMLQARPPEGQKGRMIGAMNLINWIGIMLSAVVYQIGTETLPKISWMFALLAAIMLPVALFYRPRETQLR